MLTTSYCVTMSRSNRICQMNAVLPVFDRLLRFFFFIRMCAVQLGFIRVFSLLRLKQSDKLVEYGLLLFYGLSLRHAIRLSVLANVKLVLG